MQAERLIHALPSERSRAVVAGCVCWLVSHIPCTEIGTHTMQNPLRLVALLSLLSPAVAQSTLPNRVASGDVLPTSAWLWTRTTCPGPVRFRISLDPNFAGGVQSRTVLASDIQRPVKVQATALLPGRQYHFEARDACGTIDRGTFRTPHRPTQRFGLRFGVSGDSRGDVMPFHSVTNAAGEDLDLFVLLGDTIYADVESPALPGVSQAQTLAEFRAKHAEVNGGLAGINGLADLRASTALLATIDDHEVTNDFAGGASPLSDPRFGAFGSYINESELYSRGIQAFVEYHPMASTRYGQTGDPRTAFKRSLYRARRYGLDAELFLLDARSFRDEELPAADPSNPLSVFGFLTASFNPARTMLGRRQLDDLKAALAESQQLGVTWKFVMVPEPIQNLGIVAAGDRFEGYAAERTELLQFIVSQGIDNVVFVAADIHGTLVNDLSFQTQPGGPQLPTGAFEITTGAIAYDAPFGPTVVGLGAQLGLVTPQQYALYLSLPTAFKDAFVRQLVDAQLAQLGYDPVGLENGPVQATLLQGGYVATHVYGWTEFEISAADGALLVTTWGIEPSSPVTQPNVVQQFRVLPR